MKAIWNTLKIINNKHMQKQPSQRVAVQQKSSIRSSSKQDITSASSRQQGKDKEQQNRRDSFQQAAVKQVLMSNQVGDGLWCYQKEKENQVVQAVTKEIPLDPELVKQSERIVNGKQKALNAQFECEMIDLLEKQCQELGQSMEIQSVQVQNQKIEIAQLNQKIDGLQRQNGECNKEIENLRGIRTSLEGQVETVKDLYNKAKRELQGLGSQLQNEMSERQSLERERVQLLRKLEDLGGKSNVEFEQMRERIEELEEENDDYRNRLQIRGDLEKRIDQERTKQQNQQKLHQISETERKLEKMGKLLEENSVMAERLAESEVLRRRFMERNQLQEKELKQLQEQNAEQMKQLVSMKKRINDLSIMKSTNNRILEDKISKLSEQNEAMLKENQKLKRLLQKHGKQKQCQEESGEEEESEEVQAKPQLFGA